MEGTYPYDQEQNCRVTLSEGSWTPLTVEAWHYGHQVLAANLVRGSHASELHSYEGGEEDLC